MPIFNPFPQNTGRNGVTLKMEAPDTNATALRWDEVKEIFAHPGRADPARSALIKNAEAVITERQ